MILKARYVAPVDQPVIENGAVRIEGDRIAAVAPATELARTGEESIDYGDAIITPGFVNAHTHLELSALAGVVPPSPDFTDWLTRLVAKSNANPPTIDSLQAAMRSGIEQSLRAGVTTIGDITRFPAWTRESIAGSPLRAVSFGEVIAIGTCRGTLEQRIDDATDPGHTNARIIAGISPHAPYTLEPPGLRACAEKAKNRNLPICVHAAETREESQFTRNRTGPFADYLRRLQIWDDEIPTARLSPLELLESTGLLTERTILAHCNYVTDDDLKRIAGSGASVAYCPQTHAAFDHATHRFREMLRAGINVCVGTDSLASNPTLSMLDELRFLAAAHPDLPAQTLLEMGTLRAARALGLDKETGSITPGKSADLAIIPLDANANWMRLVNSDAMPCHVISSGIILK